jgi:type II secretory pathway component PulC
MVRESINYRLQALARGTERWGAPLAWLVAAALTGWAIALLLGVLGDREASKLPAWKPAPLAMDLKPRQPAATATPTTANNAPWQLVGIADDRVYVRSNNKPASFAEGETLPNGDVIKKIERDAIVVSSGGKETRVALYKTPAIDAAKTASGAAASNAAAGAVASCRLSAQDRANATFIESAVAAALTKETATFNRIFVPIVAAAEGGGGVRASGTGGTTSAFGIQDGDALLRAEGRTITSGQFVLSEIIGRVQRGDAVVVEGERSGAPRRWVFAPSSCRA